MIFSLCIVERRAQVAGSLLSSLDTEALDDNCKVANLLSLLLSATYRDTIYNILLIRIRSRLPCQVKSTMHVYSYSMSKLYWSNHSIL